MSTELEARLFLLPADAHPGDLFARLVTAVDAWSARRGAWQGLEVWRAPGQLAERAPAEQPIDLLEQARKVANGDVRLASAVSFAAWRFAGEVPRAGALTLTVETWGPAYRARCLGDPRVRGCAALRIETVGPFCALVAEPRPAAANAVNAKVEENLGALSDLLLAVATALAPASLALYSDAGECWPLNAHWLWYRDAAAAAGDAALIADAWERGLERARAAGAPERTAPLARLAGAEAALYFHGWRSDDQRGRLSDRLSRCASAGARVTAEHVRALVASGRFDTLTGGDAFAVLGYPHYVNGFLDRFWLELLESAA